MKADLAAPLLTIAIPSFNRAEFLEQALLALEVQLAGRTPGLIEVFISDNASTDRTPQLVEQFIARGLPIRYHRQPENVGSDANFITCYENARGQYLWMCGDDDVLVPPRADYPGAIADLLTHIQREEFDLIYATSFGFQTDWKSIEAKDQLDRDFHIITDARRFARIVNIMFTFVSGLVINRRRLEELRAADSSIEAPRAFLGTNLTQLSWTLPLLAHHRRSLVLWRRPVAARQGAANGYSLPSVFGENLTANLRRCLPHRPDLAQIIINFSLRRWFPSILYDMRTTMKGELGLEQANSTLRRVFGNNARFWLFTWPVLNLPLPLAKLALTAGKSLSFAIYAIEIPGFWKKRC